MNPLQSTFALFQNAQEFQGGHGIHLKFGILRKCSDEAQSFSCCRKLIARNLDFE